MAQPQSNTALAKIEHTLAAPLLVSKGGGMTDSQSAIIHAVLAKTPEWIRAEFASKDASARGRAEEALAAMIAAALSHAQQDVSELPA